MVFICCEGPKCNSGVSAAEREKIGLDGYGKIAETAKYDNVRYVRLSVTRALAVTPHEQVGFARRGSPLYACTVCGFERQYGGNAAFRAPRASEGVANV